MQWKIKIKLCEVYTRKLKSEARRKVSKLAGKIYYKIERVVAQHPIYFTEFLRQHEMA